jgi:hypothetical protein
MARRTSTEETKLLKVIERMPLDPDTKTRWVEILQDSGLNEDLAKEIQETIAGLEHPEEEDDRARQARASIEVNNTIRRWRLSENLKNMGRR